MLLFHANEYVPTERLVCAVWPDEPPKSYAANLHTYVSRLRDRIGGPAIDHGPAFPRSSAPRPTVTARESDILNAISQGHSVRQTARRLGIAAKTVLNTQARLFNKLGVSNRAAALAAAHRLGLLEPPPTRDRPAVP